MWSRLPRYRVDLEALTADQAAGYCCAVCGFDFRTSTALFAPGRTLYRSRRDPVLVVCEACVDDLPRRGG